MINSSVDKISKFDAWVMASRPKTLPAALVPVLVGSAIAFSEDKFKLVSAIVALICSVLIQVGTNFANDLYDHIKGSDTDARKGPVRASAAGLLSVSEMRNGTVLAFLLAFLFGLYLVYTSGWIILVIGLISIFAGFSYTGGPYPLAYNALGDIFVFLFFGLVGTVFTYFIHTNSINMFAVWASVPVGALITNILVVNNYRDIEEDEVAGKITLAVKFGKRFSRIQYVIFMLLSYTVPFIVFFTFKQSLFVLLPLLSFPLSFKLINMIYTLEGKALNKTLELTAKLSAIYGLLFALGLIL